MVNVVLDGKFWFVFNLRFFGVICEGSVIVVVL